MDAQGIEWDEKKNVQESRIDGEDRRILNKVYNNNYYYIKNNKVKKEEDEKLVRTLSMK